MLIAPMILPCVAVIAFFVHLQDRVDTHSERFATIERRLDNDEAVIHTWQTGAEDRLRAQEIDNSTRLTAIETRLGAIEGYMMEINLYIRQERLR